MLSPKHKNHMACYIGPCEVFMFLLATNAHTQESK
jgi:hypothetical protein